jgi:hypothetical protein
MTTRPIMPEGTPPAPPDRGGVKLDLARLWSGGVATAIVAGLVALVGVLVSRWLFHLPVLAPRRDGAYGDVHTTSFVLIAAGAALVATALLNLLLLSTPRPLMFFGWIVGLATVLGVVFPFSTGAALGAKVATALVDLVIGFAIGSLLSAVGGRSARQPALPPGPPPPDYPAAPRYDQPWYEQPRYDAPRRDTEL